MEVNSNRHWLIWDMSSQRVGMLTQPCRYSEQLLHLRPSLLLPRDGAHRIIWLLVGSVTRPFRITHWLLFLRSHAHAPPQLYASSLVIYVFLHRSFPPVGWFPLEKVRKFLHTFLWDLSIARANHVQRAQVR